MEMRKASWMAMLTAMNIASELDRLGREVDAELQAVDHELASSAVLLDAVVAGDAK